MITTDELLLDRQLKIEWAEPTQGLNADGTAANCMVTLSAKVDDVIKMSRQALHTHDKDLALSERELLEEFMIVHWAAGKRDTRGPGQPIGYVNRDNGIRGPGFASWLEPVFSSTNPPSSHA